MIEFVGRGRERAALAAVLDDAAQGRSSSVVVRGVAGVGKSRLLDQLAETAAERGFDVVRAVGTQFERDLPFTGLAAIVAGRLDTIDQLDPRYANALNAALGLSDGSTPQLAVSMAMLTFLAALAEARPVLVIIDDLHWLDAATATALSFAVQRVDADAVAIVMGTRPDEIPAPLRTVPTIDLEELDDSEIPSLLEPHGMTPEVIERCGAAMGGNPLGLLELARRLSEDQRAGREPLPEPLPVPERLADTYEPLIDALPDPTRRALEIAAVATTGDLLLLRSALKMAEIDPDELSVAERAGLVTLGPEGLRWVHPLARATVLQSAGHPDRRAAHRAIAEVLDPERAADQVAWHLSAAATGPDEHLAGLLVEAGAAARRRGALVAASQAFARAAQLSETDERRVERLERMGQAMWAGGSSASSTALFHHAMRLTRDPVARARFAVTIGEAVVWSDGVGPAVELFERHARAMRDVDAELSAHLHVRAAGTLILAGQVRRAREQAEAAQSAAAAAGSTTATFAAGIVRAVADLLEGAPGAEEALAPITDLTLALLPAGESGIEMAAQLAGFSACVTENWSQAEDLLGGVITIGDDLGMLGLMAVAVAVRADGRFRAGRWSEAFADLTNLVSLVHATDERAAEAFTAAYLARVEAGRGMEQQCVEHATAALETAERLGIGAAALWAHHALAVLHLGAGQAADAAAHLDIIAADLRDWGASEPGVLWWHADHVEALIACGRTDEARDAVAQLEDAAARTGRGYAQAAAAWCRGMLLEDGDPERDDRFTEAIERFNSIDASFEASRALLGRGLARVRAGDRAGGQRDVAAARSRFERLGARMWAERARAVLGGETEDAQPTLVSTLTPAELRVALCVGAGATNREASDQLFVSVKTVDYHLQNIYRKLDVRSRTQLAAIVAKEQQGA